MNRGQTQIEGCGLQGFKERHLGQFCAGSCCLHLLRAGFQSRRLLQMRINKGSVFPAFLWEPAAARITRSPDTVSFQPGVSQYKVDQGVHFQSGAWGICVVEVAWLILPTQYRRFIPEDIRHFEKEREKGGICLFSTYSKNISDCFSKSLKCASVWVWVWVWHI